MTNLTALLTPTAAVSPEPATVRPAPKRAENEKFAGFLEKTGKPREAVKQQSVKRDRRDAAKADATTMKAPEAKAETSDVKADATLKAEAADTAAAKPAAETAEDVNAKMLAALAETLEMPMDALVQLLAQLNMTAIELLEPEALSVFIQKLTGVESKEQLLNVPDVQNLFKQVNETLAPFADQAKTFAQAMQVTQNVPMVQQAEDAVPVQIPETEAVQTLAAPQQAPVAKPQAQNAPQNEQFAEDGTQSNQPQLDRVMNPAAQVTDVPQQTEMTAVRAEALRNVDTQSVIGQLTETMKVEIKGNTSEMKLQLKPEHLGDVSLKIVTQNGVVTAQFVAESQRIKEIIEAGFSQLRDALQQQGIQLSQLSVTVGDGQNEQQSLYQRERNMSARRIESIVSGITVDEAPVIDENGEELTDASMNYLA